MITIDSIQNRIQELRAKAAEKVGFEIEDVFNTLVAQITVDRTNIISYTHICCRYCFGQNGEYQWRTQREFRQAEQEYTAKAPAGKTGSLSPNDKVVMGIRAK